MNPKVFPKWPHDKPKGDMLLEPLNCVNTCNDKAGPSAKKNVPSETSYEHTDIHIRKDRPRANIHKSADEFIAKKRQVNARYQKNVKERKRLWKSKNSNFVNQERSANQNENSSSKKKPKSFSKPQSLTPLISKPKTFPKPSVAKQSKSLEKRNQNFL